MNDQTLHMLEFDKIKNLLKGVTATSVGKERAGEIKPFTDIEKVTLLQNETDEAMHVLRLDKTAPFAHITDINGALKRCEIGSTLASAEFVDIAAVIYSGRQLKRFIEKMDIEIPLLKMLAADIVSLKELETEIHSKIDEHGDVLDSASVALRSIRQSVRTYETRIRERLNHLTKTKSNMLSDAIVTIRNDRFVLPVKQAYKAAIGGIVHDQSSSGQTLFMEPKAVIELNNGLQQALVKEKREIDVILQKLTREVAVHTDTLRQNLLLIAELDFIFARARLARDMKASKPILNTSGIIDMKQVRHPLISMDQAIPSDIQLGEDFQALVITGPNTGGKTVTLKTIGLCVVMAQAGLQIPALDGGKLGCFGKVFADIGDEQSIEQNLSTFSSHMTNIVNIMGHVDDNSLVLFDELGAGTDPQEGAALAMALLDEVIEIGARVVATTHYPELKAYGFNRSAVMNASVEFDVETLSPTYRLLMGVPGRSNAFEISQRLGLNAEIIQAAKGHIGIDSENVENMIGALEKARENAEKEYIAAHEFVIEAEKIRNDLAAEWEKFQSNREKMFKKAEQKANRALEKAREEAEIIVAEIRQMKNTAMWKEHEWIEARKLLDEAKPELVQREMRQQPSNQPQEFAVGDEIKHRSFGQIGEIIEKKNNKEYVIQVGMMKITAKEKDLTFVAKGQKKEAPKPVSHVLTTSTTTSVKPELDLRGKRYEEAMLSLEKYLDDALLQGYGQVTVIHGKGTGALRKGVEKFIQAHSRIASHRIGGQNEGGSGVTILELQ